MVLRILLICLLVAHIACTSVSKITAPTKLSKMIRNDSGIANILDSFSMYESQIIYIQIDRDKNNHPHFKQFAWNVDSTHYFYPASMVKMPVAILAAEKINKLSTQNQNIHLYTPIKYHVGHTPQTEVFTDSSSSNLLPSIGHYIKKVFMVSDNDAYNRLYEFNGQFEINRRLKELGHHHTHIIARLDAPAFDYVTNKYTNPWELYQEDLPITKQPELYNEHDVRITGLKSSQKGIGYISGDQLIKQPFDFNFKNYYGLEDMVLTLKKIIFPETFPAKERFDLTPSQLEFIRTQMSKYPHESRHPKYSPAIKKDYVKYFLSNLVTDSTHQDIRIFNKVGAAYGFLTDVSYIVDFKQNIEFILAATIQVNKDGIFNDGIYEYNSLGLPYFAKLGHLFYNHERKRNKNVQPILSALKLDYTE